MVNQDQIEDITVDLLKVDNQIRKMLTLPPEMENPALVASRLCGLSRQASALAQAILSIVAYERDRELLKARFIKEQD